MVNICTLIDQAKQYLNRCELCSAPTRSALPVCAGCLHDLPTPLKPCIRCGLEIPLTAHSNLCGNCQKAPPSFHRTQSLFTYAYPVDRLIRQFKFNQRLHLARLFGNMLGSKMRDFYSAEQLASSGILPVPLHHKRRRERGYNQAFEIARFCAKSAGIPLLDKHCLRIKHTQHQPGLSRSERQRNIRGAFTLTQNPLPQCVLILDDVLTTGTTCEALARVLVRAGVQQIHIWCVARAL